MAKEAVMAKVESLGIKRHRVGALLRPRPGAQPPLLHRGHGLRRDRRELRGADRARPREVARLHGGQLRGHLHRPARRRAARASRYLRKHPDGVGTLNFEVEDAAQAFAPAREARRHAHRRDPSRRRTRRRRDRVLLDRHALRRHDVPLHRAQGLPRALPGFEAYDDAARRGERRSASRASTTSPRTSRP